MASEDKPKCKDCDWWYETAEGITVPPGWCHRMPHTEPKGEYEWCGEFEKKKKLFKKNKIEKR